MKKFLAVLLSSSLFILSACNSTVKSNENTNIAGSWSTVDFVKRKSNFNPMRKQFKGDLFLKELTLKKDGSTNFLALKWSEDLVIKDTVENTTMNLELNKVAGKEYLFLEWVNGDVVRGAKPKFYVLKRMK